MPRATYDATKTWKFDLETLEGGFVELRKLSFGQTKERVELASRMAMTEQSRAVAVELMQKVVAEYEFKHTIVDHNLEDDTGQKLDFSKAGIVGSLDPAVGDEIDELIMKVNGRDVKDLEDLEVESAPV